MSYPPGTFQNVLALRTELDPVLSVIAPMGLAAAADRPCLVIDLDQDGPNYPGQRSLADLIREGPSRRELLPVLDRRHRKGVALLRNGGAALNEAEEVIHSLTRHWPAIVLRLPGSEGLVRSEPGTVYQGRVVPLIPLLPGLLAPTGRRAAVWQSIDSGQPAPGPGPVLPALSRAVATRLLSARWEPRGRWVKAWHVVWELPWP